MEGGARKSAPRDPGGPLPHIDALAAMSPAECTQTAHELTAAIPELLNEATIQAAVHIILVAWINKETYIPLSTLQEDARDMLQKPQHQNRLNEALGAVGLRIERWDSHYVSTGDGDLDGGRVATGLHVARLEKTA